jgi:hypothetical protein
MSTNTKLYSNTQGGAPTLTGEVGSIKNILHSVLFGSGYGTITPDSITRSGTIATLIRSDGHGFIDGQVIEVSGSDQSEYNGEFRVEVLSSTNLAFVVTGTPVTPATGTITAKTPSVGGWAQRHDGTNRTVVYSSDLSASGLDFRVDDSGTTTARIIGYESTTNVDTGTNPFPTEVQLSGGGYLLKSSTANTTTRSWWIVADKKTIYFRSDYNASRPIIHGFGDLITPYSGDVYNGFVTACSNTTHSAPPFFYYMGTGTNERIWITRNHAGTVGSVLGTKRGPVVFSGVYQSTGNANYAYPSPITTSGILFGTGSVKVEIQGGGEFRGFFPGVVPILNNLGGAVSTGTVFRGVSGFDPLVLFTDWSSSHGSVAFSLGDW